MQNSIAQQHCWRDYPFRRVPNQVGKLWKFQGVGWILTSTCTPGMEIPGGWDGQKQKCPLWGYGYFLGLQIVWFSLFTGLFKRAKIQILHLVRKLSHNAQQSDYVLGGKSAMKMTDVQVLFGMDPSLGYICCIQYSSCSKNYVSYVCNAIKKGKISSLHCVYLHQICLI